MADDGSNITRLTPAGRRAALRLSFEVNRARMTADAVVAGAIVTVEQLVGSGDTARKVLARAAFDELADATSTKAAFNYIKIIANLDERDDGPDAA